MRISTAQMGKRAVTNQRPNKRLRWTMCLGFLALVYVGAFFVHKPAATKGDKLASTTESQRSNPPPVGVEEDIANYCKGDTACTNNAYAQIDRDRERCATDPDLQNFSRSYCESFAIATVITNLKWGPGGDPIGLNNLTHLQHIRMFVTEEEAAAMYAWWCRSWYGVAAKSVVKSKIRTLMAKGDRKGVFGSR